MWVMAALSCHAWMSSIAIALIILTVNDRWPSFSNFTKNIYGSFHLPVSIFLLKVEKILMFQRQNELDHGQPNSAIHRAKGFGASQPFKSLPGIIPENPHGSEPTTAWRCEQQLACLVALRKIRPFCKLCPLNIQWIHQTSNTPAILSCETEQYRPLYQELLRN